MTSTIPASVPHIVAAGAALLLAVSSDSAGEDQSYRQYAVNAPAPVYPPEARARHETGSGIVLVDVDSRTGYVVGARMLQSTGYVILDHAAIGTFSRWRFKPGTVRHVRIPVHFVLRP